MRVGASMGVCCGAGFSAWRWDVKVSSCREREHSLNQNRDRNQDQHQPEPSQANSPHGALHDVLVIGGGVVGLAVARECAVRGYSVLLLEREPWLA